MTRRVRPRAWALFLLLFVLSSASTVLAQERSADEILDEVAATAEQLADAAFLLTGRLIDADGTEIALELEVQVLPDARVASAYILQPDALADNIIVLDGDAVYNYTFLTHQVTIYDADDPDALGGLIGAGDDGEIETTFDLERLFSGYGASLAGEADTPEGPATVVRLDNLEEGAVIASVDATIPDSTSLPYRLEMRDQDGELLAELRFEQLRTGLGLDPEEVAYLPEDAEIIDERTSEGGGEDGGEDGG
jgi:outer membrane lipoprotein-sorting protein